MSQFLEATGPANPFSAISAGSSSALTLVDIDGDGDLDMVIGVAMAFNAVPLGFYRNTGNATAPAYVLQSGVDSPLGGVPAGALLRSTFGDLDGDGDLDLVVGDLLGKLSYFRNDGSATAPAYASVNLTLSPLNGVSADFFASPTLLDIDRDGDLDLFIGEGSGFIRFFKNTGTATAPDFEEQTGAANPLDGLRYGGTPGPTFADLDRDGDLDMVVGGSGASGSAEVHRNTGSATAPAFSPWTGASNPLDGLDIASGPVAIADIDGDGALDLVAGQATASLKRYEAATTPEAVVYAGTPATGNPFNGIDAGAGSTPSLGDVDGDGDLDLVIGNQSGNLHYYRNTGTATDPAYAAPISAENPFNGIVVQFRSRPTLADIDRDGDLDLVLGQNNGELDYYRNTGTATDPAFGAQAGTDNPFDFIDVGLASIPSLGDIDGDGDLDLVVGNDQGELRYFRNDGTATAPAYTFALGTASPFNGINVGSQSHPSLADIDADGDLDLVVGALSNALQYLLNTGTATAPAYARQTGTDNPFSAFVPLAQSAPAMSDIDADGDLDLVLGIADGLVLTAFNNDAPTLSQATFNLTGTDEDTDSTAVSVASLLASAGWTDTDARAQQGLAITATTGGGSTGTASSHWEFRLPGTGWTPLGAVSETAAVLLSADAELRFVPDRENGETASLSFRAWDQTSGTASTGATRSTADTTANGGGTAFSGASSTASLVVTSVNDAPTLSVSAFDLTATNEETTFVTTGSALLAAAGWADADINALQGLVVTATTGAGQWQWTTEGSYWASVRGIETFIGGLVAAIPFSAATSFRYVPDARNGETATISFRAWDQTTQSPAATLPPSAISYDPIAPDFFGGTASQSAAVSTASLLVTSVNDAPVLRAFTERTGAANPMDAFARIPNSTPTFGDLDGDGDLDLVRGDADGGLRYYRNTGTASAPAYAAQLGSGNPFGLFDVGSASTPVLVDIDGDLDLDLVVGEEDGFLNFYRNSGTPTAPAFGAVFGGVFSSIDVGSFSAPSFADLDGDRDLDLIVGETDGVLNYFRNVGVPATPIFAPVTGGSSPFNGIDAGFDSTPSFVDIDRDGDLDLVVGRAEGDLIYYRNTGSARAPAYARQTGVDNPFDGIDVDSFSAPTFSDINGDGYPDLILGDGFGRLRSFINNQGFRLGETNEDTDSTPVTVAGLLASAGWADVDVRALKGLAITATTGAGWQYSVDGSTWTPIGAASATAAVLLADGAQLRYAPDRANGETASLSFRAWDQTSGTASTDATRSTSDTTTHGGTTAFSTNSSTASLVVTSVNDAPTTRPVTLTAILEDNAVTLTPAQLLANAADADLPAQTLVVSNLQLTGGSGGDLVGNPDGTWVYTPGPDDDGEVSFSYTISDGTDTVGGSATLDIVSVNDAPVVSTSGGGSTYVENGPAVAVDVGVVVSDADSPQLVGAAVSISSHYVPGQDSLQLSGNHPGITASWNAGTGQLTLSGNASVASYQAALRSVRYLNNSDASDTSARTLSFTVDDGLAISTAASRTMFVQAVNDAPTTVPVTLDSIPEDSPALSITQALLLAGSGDVDGPNPLQAVNLQIATGLGSLSSPSPGSWVYTPAPNDDTQVSFKFGVTDGLDTTPGSATLDITPVNDAPVAVADSAQASTVGGAVNIAVLANDTDIDGGPLSVSAITQGSSGSVAIRPDGVSVRYTPNAGFSGFDSFTYTANDGAGGTAVGTVRVLMPSYIGSSGNDVPLGTANADFILAGDGNDRVLTYGGADYVEGGRGADTLSGGLGADTLIGGDGADTFLTTAAELAGDSLDGGDAIDTLQITDPIAVMPAAFTLVNVEQLSFPGSLQVGHTSLLDLSALTLSGTGNQINGGTAATRITGTRSNDRITDSAGNDDLRGGDGNDTIMAGVGQDTIHGGNGNDTLGGSSSTLGDGSIDTFVFNTALNGLTNVDTVIGFEANGRDVIALGSSIFGAIGPALDASEFRSAIGGHAADANDFILFDPATGGLYYDADGNGAGARVQFATLGAGLTGTVDAADFVVIGSP